jgi:2-oxoglutarate dehydrogenase complex dehydrogenase (E1) component-like enzyme
VFSLSLPTLLPPPNTAAKKKQEELEERYRADPASVDQSWAAFFRALGKKRGREGEGERGREGEGEGERERET